MFRHKNGEAPSPQSHMSPRRHWHIHRVNNAVCSLKNSCTTKGASPWESEPSTRRRVKICATCSMWAGGVTSQHMIPLKNPPLDPDRRAVERPLRCGTACFGPRASATASAPWAIWGDQGRMRGRHSCRNRRERGCYATFRRFSTSHWFSRTQRFTLTAAP